MIRWINDKICFIDRPNSALETLLDKTYTRRPGLLQWDVPNGSSVERVRSFVTAVTSGWISDDEFEARKQICLACPAMILDKRGNKFCSGCNCGTWQLANLDGTFLPKLRWKSVHCPLKKF